MLDGFSRFIVHWEIREKMEEKDVEIVLQRALEKTPGARPRIISDNGPQFIAKDFRNAVSNEARIAKLKRWPVNATTNEVARRIGLC